MFPSAAAAGAELAAIGSPASPSSPSSASPMERMAGLVGSARAKVSGEAAEAAAEAARPGMIEELRGTDILTEDFRYIDYLKYVGNLLDIENKGARGWRLQSRTNANWNGDLSVTDRENALNNYGRWSRSDEGPATDPATKDANYAAIAAAKADPEARAVAVSDLVDGDKVSDNDGKAIPCQLSDMSLSTAGNRDKPGLVKYATIAYAEQHGGHSLDVPSQFSAEHFAYAKPDGGRARRDRPDAFYTGDVKLRNRMYRYLVVKEIMRRKRLQNDDLQKVAQRAGVETALRDGGDAPADLRLDVDSWSDDD